MEVLKPVIDFLQSLSLADVAAFGLVLISVAVAASHLINALKGRVIAEGDAGKANETISMVVGLATAVLSYLGQQAAVSQGQAEGEALGMALVAVVEAVVALVGVFAGTKLYHELRKLAGAVPK